MQIEVSSKYQLLGTVSRICRDHPQCAKSWLKKVFGRIPSDWDTWDINMQSVFTVFSLSHSLNSPLEPTFIVSMILLYAASLVIQCVCVEGGPRAHQPTKDLWNITEGNHNTWLLHSGKYRLLSPTHITTVSYRVDPCLWMSVQTAVSKASHNFGNVCVLKKMN